MPPTHRIALHPRSHNTPARPWDRLPLQIDELTVIAKVSERCNLACPYCYYFFMGDESFATRPAQMNEAAIEQTVQALSDFIDHCHPRVIDFTFHGGEPMLLKPSRFDLLCRLLRERIAPRVKLNLGIQTNGALMTEEWIGLFSRHGVNVGVSIDGPPVYQDKARPTVQGKPSSGLVLDSVRQLQRAAEAGRIRPPGSLTVLDRTHDLDAVLDYLVHTGGFRSLSFLLPDSASGDPDFDDAAADAYGDLLCRLFDQAMADPDLHIREVAEVLKHFQVKRAVPDPAFQLRTGAAHLITSAIVVMHSDATISVDDSLIPTGAWRRSSPVLALDEYAIVDLFSHPAYGEIIQAMQDLPPACADCRWKALCRGGRLEDRPQHREGFRSRSVYCSGLKRFYAHVAAFLIENGYPQSALDAALDPALFGGSTGPDSIPSGRIKENA
jgi:uncharacterized protein